MSNSLFNNKRFKIERITDEELIKIISKVDKNSSFCFDKIPIVVIKETKNFIAKPLAHVINSSFIFEIFPDKLKIATV